VTRLVNHGVNEMAISAQLAVLPVLAAIISAALIIMLRPLLARYALARPNVRSSHDQPTPQGGGIAVIAATIVVVACVVVLAPDLVEDHRQLAIVFAAAIGLAIVGVTDDVRPLEALPRLVLQAAAVGAVIAVLPAELRVLPMLPWWIERLCILIGGVWLVNLTNFMDGIDWMTVAEVVPVTAALAAFGLIGALPPDATIVALTLCGAIIGFAPFNRPVARLFLGDVGSLPIGLLLGWLLIVLAGNGHLAAALLLPLYYLADATITLLRRLASGEPVMQAHRRHFYQSAIDGGFSVYQVVGRVFLLNVGLVACAAITLLMPSQIENIAVFTAGCLFVTLLLYDFARRRKK
jgi:UDP-N-acetylmuramyl pentapeptide phosphotransferase/UDP-N-acetylglucosamine-1-phosphate transferase